MLLHFEYVSISSVFQILEVVLKYHVPTSSVKGCSSVWRTAYRTHSLHMLFMLPIGHESSQTFIHVELWCFKRKVKPCQYFINHYIPSRQFVYKINRGLIDEGHRRGYDVCVSVSVCKYVCACTCVCVYGCVREGRFK